MAGKRPWANVIAKHKETGETFQCGAIWNAPFDGAYNVSPETETNLDGPYPKLAMVDALSGDYYINAYEVGSRKNTDDEDF